METCELKRLVVKIGSQVLCDEQGRLDRIQLARLVDQMAASIADGWQLVVVSSGAVAAGSALVNWGSKKPGNPVVRKQVLAAAGQVQLMETYQQEFKRHDLIAAQVLASKSDFQSRQHYLNMRACIEGILSAGMVPVINENDVVSVTELMFTDNDELAGLVAGMIGAEQLCLLSSVEGVFSGPGGDIISRWDDELHSASDLVLAGTSKHGRGGMNSKIAVARKAARLGTRVSICNGHEAGILQQILQPEAPGTHFEAGAAATPTKRWLASMDDHTLGAVTVNPGAEQALADRGRLTSLLPVGLSAVDGEFQAGDVIQVRNEAGRVLGCGRAQYDHREALEILGKRDQKPLIHYDYLYLID